MVCVAELVNKTHSLIEDSQKLSAGSTYQLRNTAQSVLLNHHLSSLRPVVPKAPMTVFSNNNSKLLSKMMTLHPAQQVARSSKCTSVLQKTYLISVMYCQLVDASLSWQTSQMCINNNFIVKTR
jgi:hypothetical protein